LFGLGALTALVDSGAHADVTSIASVSGGSITNGWLATNVPYPTANPATFRADIRPLITVLANTGSFLGHRPIRVLGLLVGSVLAHGALLLPLGRWSRYGAYVGALTLVAAVTMAPAFVTKLGKLYGALLVPSGLAALTIAFVPAGLAGWLQLVITLLALALWIGLVLSRRGAVCRHTFTQTLFASKPKLTEIDHDVDHVFCATELQTGDSCYFSRDFVYGYQLGSGMPGNVSVVQAVNASAALPGAFPPLYLRAPQFGFSFALDDKPPPEDRATPVPTKLVLADGGVYDNMGDQWAGGFARRKEAWPAIVEKAHAPDRLIVVNASGGLRYKRWKAWPVAAEAVALKADQSVLYDQTTATRRRALVAAFDAAELGRRGLRGALVHIPQSPFDVADAFADLPDESPFLRRRGRAQTVLKWLDDTPANRQTWAGMARANRDVKTTLAALGPDVSGRLLYHAYVLTAANLHVIFDMPLPELPQLATFVALATESA
jgi:hypothetical protein